MDNVRPESKRFRKDLTSDDEYENEEGVPINIPVPVSQDQPQTDPDLAEILEENSDSDINTSMEIIVDEPEPDLPIIISLGEDILFQILNNAFLDMQDLLNCRLVDRTWCSVATSTLLKRDMCQISLKIFMTPIPSTANDEALKDIFCHERNHNLFLPDLIQLISTSSKFPCTTFRFANNLYDDKLPSLISDPTCINNFFEICGDHIKTLCLGDLLLRTNLKPPMLLSHACNLESLDLRLLDERCQDNMTHDMIYGTNQTQFEKYLNSILTKQVSLVAASFQQLPRLKKLRFDHFEEIKLDSQETLQRLLNAAGFLPLNELTNERKTNFFKLLIEIDRLDLVQELSFIPSGFDGLYSNNIEFHYVAETEPLLSKLEVNFRSLYADGSSLDVESFEKDLNQILISSKDSLEVLHFHVYRFNQIKFPEFTRLRCLKLTETDIQSVSAMAYAHLDIVEGEEQDQEQNQENYPPKIFKFFHDRSLCSFFSLDEVHLDINNYSPTGCLMMFFHSIQRCSSGHTVSNLSRKNTLEFDILPEVNSLEIYSKWPTMSDAEHFSHVFYAVRFLKLKCLSPEELNNSLWSICPDVESIEIYGMRNRQSEMKDRFNFGVYNFDFGSHYDSSILVDSFFTGFPGELCQKLQDEYVPSYVNDFLRVKPSMCDLESLKDFKIFFTEFHDVFASDVSGMYAFENMPETKITFVHTGPIEFNETECEMEKFLEPISAYVTLTHQKMPERFRKGTTKASTVTAENLVN